MQNVNNPGTWAAFGSQDFFGFTIWARKRACLVDYLCPFQRGFTVNPVRLGQAKERKTRAGKSALMMNMASLGHLGSSEQNNPNSPPKKKKKEWVKERKKGKKLCHIYYFSFILHEFENSCHEDPEMKSQDRSNLEHTQNKAPFQHKNRPERGDRESLLQYKAGTKVLHKCMLTLKNGGKVYFVLHILSFGRGLKGFQIRPYEKYSYGCWWYSFLLSSLVKVVWALYEHRRQQQ